MGGETESCAEGLLNLITSQSSFVMNLHQPYLSKPERILVQTIK